MKKSILFLAAAALAAAIFGGCRAINRPRPPATPSPILTAPAVPGVQSAATAVPGKTASQDTAGAETQLPEGAPATGSAVH